MPLFVLMGVSGTGKTTVGKAVAEQLNLRFFEGDDYHPPANVAKMSAGIPLHDADRVQWIEDLVRALNAEPAESVLVACSALTSFVRSSITQQSRRPVRFIHLRTDPAIIEARLHKRGQHYMKPGMLPSQLAALEEAGDAMTIDATPALPDVIARVAAYVRAEMG